MAQWLTANIDKKLDWHANLFSLGFHCKGFPKFKAGQFTKLGLYQHDGKLLSRPYSLINSPQQDTLEILALPVENGDLSPQLHRLQVGDTIQVMCPATGYLTIDEVPASQTLYMLSTGTGVGPFLSILQSDNVWHKHENIVLVYAVRYSSDFAYIPTIHNLLEENSKQFSFVPIVSRENTSKGLHGRIPTLLNDIQLYSGVKLSPQSSQIMLCGNPDMIRDTYSVLQEMGFKKHLRRSPGQITMERYW